MAIGTIAAIQFNQHSVGDRVSQPLFDWISFKIDTKKCDPFSLMHSTAASPGRYLEEAIRRFSDLGIKTGIILLNPSRHITHFFYQEIYRDLKTESSEFLIWGNDQGIPAAYYFPPDVEIHPDDLFFLRFLSCVDTELDGLLLSSLFHRPVRKKLNLVPLDFLDSSGFYAKNSFALLCAMTSSAIRFLTNTSPGLGSVFSRLQGQATLPIIAIFPYTAGDVLFFIHALRRVSHPFNTLMVCKIYEDIVDELAPDVKKILVPEPPPYETEAIRAMQLNREYSYFYKALHPLIPENALFYYFRLYRDYNIADFHLIDQYSFSLSCGTDLSSRVQSSLPERSPDDKSVLLNFDAGWKLKCYPEPKQFELVRLLKQKGFRVSVMLEKESDLPCERFSFRSLAKFKELILKHAVFVGMDSFPIHYAAHVLQYPSICLFSSTNPANARGPRYDRYMYLNNGLDCAPCGGWDRCPVFQLAECVNFASPEQVAKEVECLYDRSVRGQAS